MRTDQPYCIQHINLAAPLADPETWIGYFAVPHLLVVWWEDLPLGLIDTRECSLPVSQPEWERLLWACAWPAVAHRAGWLATPPAWPEMHRQMKDWLEMSMQDKVVAAPSRHPSVALVICTAGSRPEALRECLHSIQKLQPQPDEIVMVNNTPGPLHLPEETLPGLRLIDEPRCGLDYARNAGWRAATSDIVLYIDDDVQVYPTLIRAVKNTFIEHPEIHALTGLVLPARLDTLAQRLFEAYWSFQRGFIPQTYTGNRLNQQQPLVPVWEIGAGACMAFRKSVLAGSGGFDQRLDAGAAGCNGDSELWYRLLVQDYAIRYEPAAVVFHHHRTTLPELHQQIFSYLRGFTTALWISYRQFRRKADWQHLTRTLPAYYAQRFRKALRYRFRDAYHTWADELRGFLAGWLYAFRHRHQPPYPEPAGPIVLPPASPSPLVSVVITCYQQAHYLPDAIRSVLEQTYPHVECLVVDDGSTDDTAAVAALFPGVRYVYQANQGLAAARNTGIGYARGEWIIFLDADDWLYPAAIETQLRHAAAHPEAAIITGHHDKTSAEGRLLQNWEPTDVPADPETALLQGNYIGMHAAVCYRREVFHYLQFDTTLRAAEDYDLYLRAARLFRIHSHLERVAAYRLHPQNMSGQVGWMLHQVLHVLRRHYERWPQLKQQSPYASGKKIWKKYYAGELLRRLQFRYFYGKYSLSPAEWMLCIRWRPRSLLRAGMHLIYKKIRAMISRFFPRLQRHSRYSESWVAAYVPPRGQTRWGDLRQTRPFSARFGFDRGKPVDRYYIEDFLFHYRHCIRGHVLEIGDNSYTRQFGGDQVSRSDVLHVRAEHPGVTVVGDLNDHIPLADGQLDCIILTQTLHLLACPERAIAECSRLLKPGGALLLTVPGITPIDHDEWKDSWQGSFTSTSLSRLLRTSFAPENLNLHTYGNVLAATAFLYGLVEDELTDAEKNDHDPHFPVIIAACAIKHLTIKSNNHASQSF
ncbi:glycosyltransferase [Thermoflavifilum thermophilum]|uniref:Glycosyltransferase involved in cell wall bisynthesis n=1 Tax=Thermoflavifilum thermophilum TaxID=1393122 RepID=A0A1I7NBM1_9BACT|nr:glycosyltransferase [Thermoflavifilum thermophilum]SFV32058.1 Glycosyltransferase involved in cell wall bisynthesis [Thermoflavifilum thermophilum]